MADTAMNPLPPMRAMACDRAEARGSSVGAEGVETPGQAQVLTGLGCDLLQGFGLSHPMPLADVLPTLSAWRPTVAGTPARAVSV